MFAKAGGWGKPRDRQDVSQVLIRKTGERPVRPRVSWLVFDEVGQLKCEYLFLCVRVIGVDFETIKVANDKQRRVIQVFTVLKQLPIGGLEVFVFALVFPGE